MADPTSYGQGPPGQPNQHHPRPPPPLAAHQQQQPFHGNDPSLPYGAPPPGGQVNPYYNQNPYQSSQYPPRNFQYRPPQFYIAPEDPLQKKRRRWLYFYYGLRQASLIIPFVLIILNINIYVSRRGRYLNNDTSAVDPVYYSMWLTVPLSGVIAIWAIVGLVCIRKGPQRGGLSYQAQFGVELLFALGAMVCFVMMVVNMTDKQNSSEYEYPYLRYEVPLVVLLGLLIFVQIGLVSRALFEVNLDRKRREEGHVVSV